MRRKQTFSHWNLNFVKFPPLWSRHKLFLRMNQTLLKKTPHLFWLSNIHWIEKLTNNDNKLTVVVNFGQFWRFQSATSWWKSQIISESGSNCSENLCLVNVHYLDIFQLNFLKILIVNVRWIDKLEKLQYPAPALSTSGRCSKKAYYQQL